MSWLIVISSESGEDKMSLLDDLGVEKEATEDASRGSRWRHLIVTIQSHTMNRTRRSKYRLYRQGSYSPCPC